VIAIIAVLSTLAVGVIGSAQQDARIAASRARTQLIESAMEVELEDFEVRRSPLSFRAIGNLTDSVGNGIWANSGRGGDNFLLHAKNLKRMIVADLIRSEFPSGRNGLPQRLGSFPSAVLFDYLTSDLQINAAAVDSAFRQVQPANVVRWAEFEGFAQTPPAPSQSQLLADGSEILYAILSSIEYNGSSVLDALGSAAVGDTDGDGVSEIVDAFGDPMTFEFHQRNVLPIEGFGSTQSGVWATPADELAMTNFEAVNPVLPTDLRFFVTSPTLLEIDGQPIDLQQ
jgi:type II secretory pathway pseudopilin PulG